MHWTLGALDFGRGALVSLVPIIAGNWGRKQIGATMRLFPPTSTDLESLRREFRWDVPEFFNIGIDVCDQHRDRADQVAIYYENTAGEQRSYTFGELRDQSNRLGNALRELGVAGGDRVAVILAQRPETAIAHIAIYKIGAVALPLSVLFGADALEYRLNDSGTKIVVTDHAHGLQVEKMREHLPALEHVIVVDPPPGEEGFWDLVEKSPDDLEIVLTRANDPAMLIYTSGTTGPAKGALNGHRCLIGNLSGFELSHDLFPQEGDVFWTPADWAWTGGLLDALLPSLHYGVPIVAYDGGKFDARKAFEIMERYGVRNAFIPPTAIKMLRQVANPRKEYDLKLRSIMSAGEQVTPEVYRWATDELGASLNEMWGQTEFNYLVGNCEALEAVRPGSMGKPYPGHWVAPIDESGEIVPDGEPGELAARFPDPVMFLGYWNRPEAAQAKITGEWFRTGDVGYRDEDGYLWFLGRSDDVISSAGYRIGPGEIEDCLIKHPAVIQAAAVGKPDELRGEIVKAFVVLADGYEPSEDLAEDIQNSVKTRLAAYEYPREVEFLAELPMTTTGKVRRNELRKRCVSE